MVQTAWLNITTKGKGLYPITRSVAEAVSQSQIRNGVVTVFIRHTSASLVIQENADPDVVLDLADFMEWLVPEYLGGDAPQDFPRYRHTTEGPDDMPAHIRAALTQTSLTIPIANSRLTLGTWQGIYIFEHRSSHQERSVVVQVMGEA